MNNTRMNAPILQDNFGRQITYLRLSVTDRCDFRCIYCMPESMTFSPRSEVLSLEELERVSRAFVRLGVSKIRITGGEPLVRNNVLHLFNRLGALSDLHELTLTTNGAQLSRYAQDLANSGVKRINVSLDTLDSKRFSELTRFGKLENVLDGLEAAKKVGLRVKINAVVMRKFNFDEVIALTDFALSHDFDISFIEEMPLGEVQSHSRYDEFISSDEIKSLLSGTFSLKEDSYDTGGPSRYWQASGYSGKVGFISPHSDNFCASCNRVRLTATGRLLLCLGNEHSVDLRKVMRDNPLEKSELRTPDDSDTPLETAIVKAMQIKPEKHEFDLNDAPQVVRFMNTTGG